MPIWRLPDPIDAPEPLVAAAGSRALAEVLYRQGVTTAQAMTDFLAGDASVDAPDLTDLETGVPLLAVRSRGCPHLRVR